jgi:hypothetical protein
MTRQWKKRLVILLSLLLFFSIGFLFARETTISQREGRTLAEKIAKESYQAGRNDSSSLAVSEGKSDGAQIGTRQGTFKGKREGAEAGWQDMQKELQKIRERRRELYGSGGVLVVGDSLEVLTIPHLKKELRDIPLTTSAVGGYNSRQVYNLFRKSYIKDHSIIVFDAGTNDNPNYPEILEKQLNKVISTIGKKRCLVLPTIHGLTVDGVNSNGKNSVLRKTKRNHRLTFLPDWRSIAREKKRLMADNLHPNTQGAALRARIIAKAVRRCLRKSIANDPIGTIESSGIKVETN